MAAKRQLVKSWIQYLKDSQIASVKSDPKTGKLQYNRPVTSDDISTFLDVKTNFSPEQVSKAIHMVLAKNAQGSGAQSLPNDPAEPGSDVSTWMYHGTRASKPPAPTNRLSGPSGDTAEPENTPGQDRISNKTNNKLDYDPDSISDIDYREVPNKAPGTLSPPTRKPRFKLRTKGIKEAFKDNRGYELDEEDVEQIFDILLNNKSSDKAEEPATGPAEPAKADNTEVLNKLKRTIRDTMTDEQRKALWRALNEI